MTNNCSGISFPMREVFTDSALPCKIYHAVSVDSTNQRLKEWMPQEDTVLYADFQTKGRGQGNHTWECSSRQGLLMSLLYYPPQPMPSQRLLMLSALSVCRSMEELGIAPQIKAPNDILVNLRKISGILLENVYCGDALTASIIGIGVNCYQTDFGNVSAYGKSPVSLRQLGISISVETLMSRILQYFYSHCPLSDSEIETQYQLRLCSFES